MNSSGVSLGRGVGVGNAPTFHKLPTDKMKMIENNVMVDIMLKKNRSQMVPQ